MNYASKKIWGIIGARSGSKGIKDKNIVLLDDKPLLAYSIETALAVPEIDEVIVSTDSQDYAWIAKQYGAGVILRRDELAQDDTPDYPWVRHLIDECGCEVQDLLVLLRPTTPLRDPKVVSRAIKEFEGYYSATSLRSVDEMSESAWKCCEIRDGLITWFCQSIHDNPRQMVPKTYHPNGYVDIICVSNLKAGCLYNDRIIAFITPRVTEVDTPEDLEYLRYEMAKRNR